MNLNYILLVRAIYTGLFTGIVIAIPMGPAGFESVRWTISKGLKHGIRVAAGSLIADAIDVMLINFGLLELIETNKLLEIFFWEISGIIIFYIGYRAIKKSKKDATEREKKEIQRIEEDIIRSHAVFTGFIVNFSNPMTHFFWLTLSSTIIRIWRSYGRLVYFMFAVFMLCGMFLSLCVINYFASHGRKIAAPKVSGKLTNVLTYIILAFGIGFFANGIYKLIMYIK
jgi:threonine/homoserine/homoserine lactone efflux protein